MWKDNVQEDSEMRQRETQEHRTEKKLEVGKQHYFETGKHSDTFKLIT